MRFARRPTTNGFTLVELSIVLVILGLLVGGVLTGQSLIRASELRSVITQFNGFQTATNAFRDKYFTIPGDMNNAQSFWGIAHATPATCATTAGAGTQTCNGDGDGILFSAAAGSNEIFRFWQHLANAGLITGTFDGITHGSNTVSATTANSPIGKLGGSMWFVYYWGSPNSNAQFFDGVYNNSYEVGGFVANSDPFISLFKPEELWNMDSKMDDGRPATGKFVVRATTGALSSCTDTSTTSNLAANYLLNSATLACIPSFRTAF
jgi:prepilin-type N-terminal cleavage/methylation domain-containing protein